MESAEPQHEHERAKRLMAMGQMAASLAHEIRNPLGSMELYCTLLKKDLENLPESFQLAEHIHSGIRRLDRIITNCLQFSRDLTPRRKELLSTADIFEECLGIVRARVESLGVRIIRMEEGSEPVYVDPHLVNQAVLNILANALDALEADSVKDPTVTLVSDRRAKSSWRISIEDNGPGVNAEVRRSMFDPFVTTKKNGTGLGLAIVHSIVTAHGGTITLADGSLGGLKVIFEFPGKA